MSNQSSSENQQTEAEEERTSTEDVHPETASDVNENANNDENEPLKKWPFWSFVGLVSFDTLCAMFLMLPTLPWIYQFEGAASYYTFGRSLMDLFLLSMLRIVSSLGALLYSFLKAQVRPDYPFSLTKPNGTQKTTEELEEEALEQSFGAWLSWHVARPAFACEFCSMVTTLLCLAKCLVRLNIEVGIYEDARPVHPVFWIAIALGGLSSALESNYLDRVCKLVSKWGQHQVESGEPSLIRNISSSLNLPLLEHDSLAENGQTSQSEGGADDVEANGNGNHDSENNDGAPAEPDIKSEASYKATWSDVLSLCLPDLHLLGLAFLFLLLAAAAQVYIPKFTGNILDALERAFAGDDDDDSNHHESMSDVPGFMSSVRKLIAVSILGGVFSGIRGSVFTVVGGRVNVRLRVRLMDALLVQDIGFFDVTKTGDITSRLSSDTTLVGDQVTLNVNVFLRSLVQAIGVLMFMFFVSWQLSILAFISVPAITVLSKWYGNFVRSLTKLMQKKLADGNSVSEAAISSMPTVRAFDAAPTEFKEFEEHMKKYLRLNMKAAFAYSGYATCVTSLPQLVTALVVFYGGLMVRNGDMTSGQLVEFLLYLQSLSDAFGSIGYIYSSLTQAVGAADKVFELMNRKPKLKTPSQAGTAHIPRQTSVLGVEVTQTSEKRLVGLEPEVCRGEIALEGVDMYYPARPQRRILNDMTLRIPPGKIAALVGQSGGGKSSVISLVQHLYEPSKGKILFDGQEVHELSPRWLSRHISIVSQEPTLFARSIKRNIMYGLEGTDLEPTDEEIIRVAKLANADQFIEKMPMKYETEVGERGVQLSGGQK